MLHNVGEIPRFFFHVINWGRVLLLFWLVCVCLSETQVLFSLQEVRH